MIKSQHTHEYNVECLLQYVVCCRETRIFSISDARADGQTDAADGPCWWPLFIAGQPDTMTRLLGVICNQETDRVMEKSHQASVD